MEALVNVQGWVGSSVELRKTPKGDVMRFRLATTSRYRRGGEWVDGGTVWLTVNAWRALARNAAASIRKGDPVFVSGRLRTESWVAKNGDLKEDKVLEAVTIGHDLTRGESSFRRVRHEEGEADLAPEPGEEVEDPDGDLDDDAERVVVG